ncbi:hypothetical protein DERP_008589 [Dermatophagoides pteronyssinus]|uniref:Uncharacterized protein n=1 Tax=Dermatophagoides pteronyssinus TaxID=6956 RepID=A0ABQ8IWS0_DERPT|nr:hypothetical protein DERP_008589 [Dermatophagoides pteronyssinus]
MPITIHRNSEKNIWNIKKSSGSRARKKQYTDLFEFDELILFIVSIFENDELIYMLTGKKRIKTHLSNVPNILSNVSTNSFALNFSVNATELTISANNIDTLSYFLIYNFLNLLDIFSYTINKILNRTANEMIISITIMINDDIAAIILDENGNKRLLAINI